MKNQDIKPVADKLAQDIEKSRQRQEARRSAPMVGVHEGVMAVEQKRLQRMYAPETLVRWENGPDGKPRRKNPDFHEFWGEAALHEQYLNQGYEPVLVDPNDTAKGQVQTASGMTRLYKLPFDLHMQNLKGPLDAAKFRVKGKITSDENDKARGDIARANPGMVDESIGLVRK